MRVSTACSAAIIAMLALFLVAPAFGQDRPAAEPAKPSPAGNAAESGKGPGEVTFDVVERPLRDVVAYIQEKTDVNLVLTKEAEDIPVTLGGNNTIGQTSARLRAMRDLDPAPPAKMSAYLDELYDWCLGMRIYRSYGDPAGFAVSY